MKTQPIQTSFSGGAIGQRSRGRVDLESYKKSLAECLNFIPTPQGSLIKRPGSRYFATSDQGRVRLVTIPYGVNEDFVVEVGNTLIKVFDDTGRVTNGGSNLFTNPGFVDDYLPWTYDRYTVSGGFNYAETPHVSRQSGVGFTITSITRSFGALYSTKYYRMRQQITIPGGTTANNHRLSFNLVMSFAERTSWYNADARFRIRIGTASGLQDILFNETTAQYTEGYARNFTIDFVPGVATFWVEFEVFNYKPSGSPPIGLGTPSIEVTAVVQTLKLQNTTTVTALEFASPWSSEQLPDLKWDVQSGLGLVVFAHPDVEPQALRFDGSTWTFGPFITDQPASSPWDATNGYPRAVAFWGGRLYLAGTLAFPSTLWGSRGATSPADVILAYSDFNEAAGVNPPDNSVEFTLAAHSHINWLYGGKKLLIGTDTSELAASGTQNTYITTTDFDFPVQSEWGSHDKQPAPMGRKIAYITNNGSGIRTLAESSDKFEGYGGDELSFHNRDILRPGIEELAFAGEPFYLLMAKLADGTAASCAHVYDDYDRGDRDTTGWWLLEIGGGTEDAPIISMAITKSNYGNKLWLWVWRNGLGHIETIDTSCNCPVFLDGAYIGPPTADGFVTGLDRFNNQEVSIVSHSDVGGYTIHEPVTVAGGAAVLPAEMTVASGIRLIIGLPYTARAVTLPQETSNPYGSSQSMKRRWNELGLRLLNSMLPKVNGQRLPDRTPSSPMDNPEPLFTGDTEMPILNSNDSTITIEQDLPGPTEILALFGKMQGQMV